MQIARSHPRKSHLCLQLLGLQVRPQPAQLPVILACTLDVVVLLLKILCKKREGDCPNNSGGVVRVDGMGLTLWSKYVCNSHGASTI